MSRTGWFIGLIVILLVACTPGPQLDERFTQGAACYERPYAGSIDLQTRGQVINWNFGVQLYDAPQGDVIGRLEPGERFRVLYGPVCWYVPQTSNHRMDDRVWQVELETRDIMGWIHEYSWGMLTGLQYAVQPLNPGKSGIVTGFALPAPVVFLDALPEHEPLGDYTAKTHHLTVTDYGYITVSVAVDELELVNVDVLGGELSCRVIAMLEPALTTTAIIGQQMRIGGRDVERIWVEPGDYIVEVSLRFIPSGNHEVVTCLATTYTLTITPVD